MLGLRIQQRIRNDKEYTDEERKRKNGGVFDDSDVLSKEAPDEEWIVS